MRTIPDFADELRKLDSRLDIVKNPNNPSLANIKLDGMDVCPVPYPEIQEESDPNFTITFPNGFTAKHRSIREATALVKDRLEMIKTKEGADIFFGR